MNEVLAAVFLLIGASFSLIAAVGIVKFPDVFTRMHASAKSGTLGGGCIMLAFAIRHSTLEIWAQTILIVLFFVLTAPIAAHAIGRAAYILREPLWKGSVVDEPRRDGKIPPPEND